MRKLVTMLLLMAACVVAVADDGVSRTLALYRTATVGRVSYDLSFTIPAATTQPVTGTVTVRFNYSGTGDLPLDFTGRLLKNHNNAFCEINGKSCKQSVQRDGHIVLPRELLNKGGNTVTMAFASSDASLNRHEDYMYTLFVPANARSCFPCFDQPDLKALFSVRLKCPIGWTTLTSAQRDHPIPTYLFSFVAGKFNVKTATRDGRVMTALYRETDSAKVAQMDKVFDEAAYSIRWLEQYTGISCPFQSYGLVVLPGYQFGGMEHPGAIQLTDHEIFLGSNPTPDEELTRLELIAHETAHLWFGDLVTMRWFDDVWTKEVFANFLANKISREVFPDVNHSLNFLKSYQRTAIAVDRTDGTHPIQQPLTNLKDAGLLYGNIIYDKAPVMMRKLEQQTGRENFRCGLQAYLRKFSYGNATWDELVGILDSVAPQARLKDFSDVWVKQKGLPTISLAFVKPAKGATGYSLTVRQADPYGHGLVWPQSFAIGVGYGDSIVRKVVNMNRDEVTIPISSPRKMGATECRLFPNIDGQGYGRFVIDDNDMDANISLLVNGQQKDETAAYSTLLNLHENYLMGRLSDDKFFTALCQALGHCTNPLIGSTIVGSMGTVRHYAPDSLRQKYEKLSLDFALRHQLRPVRQQLLRSIAETATAHDVTDTLYYIWQHQSDTTALPKDMLTARDYTRMAFHLAIVLPGKANDILAVQRTKLKTGDERREFDYVSRACTADTVVQKQLFLSMIPKSGRTVELWARQMLALLCDGLREPLCNSYIRPGLDNLLMIQQTSDIFFPGYWLSALLSGQRSTQARAIVEDWIATHADYPAPLMNKLKQAAYGLLRR